MLRLKKPEQPGKWRKAQSIFFRYFQTMCVILYRRSCRFRNVFLNSDRRILYRGYPGDGLLENEILIYFVRDQRDDLILLLSTNA